MLIFTKFALFLLSKVLGNIFIMPAEKTSKFFSSYLRPQPKAPFGRAVLAVAHPHLRRGADGTQGVRHGLLSLESPFLDTLNETTLFSSSTGFAALAPFTC